MLLRSARPSCQAFARLSHRNLPWSIPTLRQEAHKRYFCDSRRQGRTPSERGASSMSASATPVRDSMQEKLQASLKPISIDIKDESSQHAGHAAMKGLPSSETHFRVAITSPEFEGLSTIKRHKLVYQVLAEELAGPVHALSLKTKTPSES